MLALELQLEDARSASDSAYALQLYHEDLESLQQDYFSNTNEHGNGNYTSDTHQQAPAALLRPHVPSGWHHYHWNENQFASKLTPEQSLAASMSANESLFNSNNHQTGPAANGNSNVARVTNPPDPPTEIQDCLICVQEIPVGKAVSCTGGHDYCHECMLELFRRAVATEADFPAKCCTEPLPVELIILFAPADLVRQYRAKEIEHNTTDRTYCSRPNCSAFLPSTAIRGNRAACPACGTQTCSACKGQFHNGACGRAADAAVLALGEREGWRRCPRCRTLVEQAGGCNHMSKCCIMSTIKLRLILVGCPCDAEFCYRYGSEWRTCNCEDWDPYLLEQQIRQEDNEGGRYDIDEDNHVVYFPFVDVPNPHNLDRQAPELAEAPRAPQNQVVDGQATEREQQFRQRQRERDDQEQTLLARLEVLTRPARNEPEFGRDGLRGWGVYPFRHENRARRLVEETEYVEYVRLGGYNRTSRRRARPTIVINNYVP